MLMVLESKMCFPSFKCCLLSDRKSVIHLQMESGMCSWEGLSFSRTRIMGVKGGAEIHKQDPGVGSCRVQVLKDVVEAMFTPLSKDLLAL